MNIYLPSIHASIEQMHGEGWGLKGGRSELRITAVVEGLSTIISVHNILSLLVH